MKSFHLNSNILKNILTKHIRQINSFPVATYSTNVETKFKDPYKTFTNLKTSYASSISEIPLISKTIPEIIKENASTDLTIYNFPHQGVSLNYKELSERVDTMAQNYLDMGFQKGDRVGIILPNTWELAVSFFAATKIGLIVTILNPGYQIVELEFMLKKAAVKGLIIYDSFRVLNHLDIIKKLCPELDSSTPGEMVSKNLPFLKHVFIVQSPFNTEKKLYKGTWEFSRLSETNSTSTNNQLPYVELDDPSLILFTSGTTGKPKGALMTHGSLLNSVNLSTQNVGVEFSGSNSICVPIPFFHIYGFSTGLLLPLIGKSKQVFPFYFPETLSTIKSVEKYKCNWLRGTPTQFFDLISHPERKKHDLSSLKSAVIAGSTVPSDLLKKMLEELKVEDIVVGYGMTETSLCHSQTTVLDKFKSDEYAYQTCGRPIPWTESKIVDPNTGQIQPLNVDGELYIRGPHLIKQYWDEPEKTSDTIDKNGWLKTGDIFSMDEQGFLFFKSRNKDIIIRGGVNIYPAEIEGYLRTHQDIAGAEAFGVPDERLGEDICVWIIRKPGSQLNEEDVKNYCKGNISHFKIPRYIKFVDRFIINANNKALKHKMREETIKEHNT